MKLEQLKQAKERYEVIASLLVEGQFSGAAAPAVTSAFNYVKAMSNTIQEQINGSENQNTPSDKPDETTPGLGAGGVPSKRRRKNSKKD